MAISFIMIRKSRAILIDWRENTSLPPDKEDGVTRLEDMPVQNTVEEGDNSEAGWKKVLTQELEFSSRFQLEIQTYNFIFDCKYIK